ncbi:hypothetical protein PA598K_00010 [Paenibacillus sp. 598K]|uniref:DUF5696 domain-containing protein n=1 Tax=Paenibacillus sp. 598K TaxID=1117987 RepID=UPI000FFA5BB6|nr:DUF5696 domain-containing protein [Paenibacillus sp. 598K]GBF71798.1 hypothetical protein PA598K_00010 [Paenibacillus sp. 598K]
MAGYSWGRMRRWLWLASLAILLAITTLLLTGRGEPKPDPVLALVPAVAGQAAYYEGEAAWVPDGKADSEGYYLALGNEQAALWLHPETTQLKLVNKQNGYAWRSSPADTELEQETVKGLLLGNLKSPFILEFSQLKSGGKYTPELANATDNRLETTITRYDAGIQVTYSWPKLGIRFAMQYELMDGGLKVTIPERSLREQGDARIMAISVLPFLGSAAAASATDSDSGSDGLNGDKDDGYLFIPEGPGGLIRFEAERLVVGQGFSKRVYGSEPSGGARANEWVTRPVAYPVFGVRHGADAYLAIIRDGAYEARVKALSPGMKSNRYSVNVDFIYREEYMRQTSRISPAIVTLQDGLTGGDRVVEYRLLAGDQADYAGMAMLYQADLAARGMLGARLEPVDAIPLHLDIVGGSTRAAFNSRQYIATTTYSQAEQMLRALTARGVSNITAFYSGWQRQAGEDAGRRYPLADRLGGAAGAQDFITAAHELGYRVLFKEKLVWAGDHGSLSPKRDAIYGMDQAAFFDKWLEAYILHPLRTIALGMQSMERLGPLGADGLHYDAVGELRYADYKTGREQSRAQAAGLYQALLGYTQQQLGLSAVDYGFADTLGDVNAVTRLPIEPGSDVLVDEYVPFYPMVLHGYVAYSAQPGNLRSQFAEEQLKALEYGAVPAYSLAWSSARALKDTLDDEIFSARFSGWEDMVAEEYARFNELAATYHLRIVDHRRLDDGVYETVYEDGTRTVADYNRMTFKTMRDGEVQYGG